MTKQFFTEADCDYHESNHRGPIGVKCYISIARANELIEERGKVVSCKSIHGGLWDERIAGYDPKGSTHTAILINIQPIARDSAEKLVKDLVACCEGKIGVSMNEWLDRARALLGKG